MHYKLVTEGLGGNFFLLYLGDWLICGGWRGLCSSQINCVVVREVYVVIAYLCGSQLGLCSSHTMKCGSRLSLCVY